jgi:anthranilate phosphoribosyltransferase
VVLNAAAALYVGGLAADLETGVAKAIQAIDSGAAANVLERLIAATAPSGV